MRATSWSLRRSCHTWRLARLSRRRAAVLDTPPDDTDQRIAPPARPGRGGLPDGLLGPGPERQPEPLVESRERRHRVGREVLVADHLQPGDLVTVAGDRPVDDPPQQAGLADPVG